MGAPFAAGPALPHPDPRQQVEDALVALLLKWWGPKESFQTEARTMVRQFLEQYPDIHNAAENKARMLDVVKMVELWGMA